MSTTTDHLTPHLDADARRRLDGLVHELGDEPERISVLFPAVGRRVARGPSDADDPDGICHPRLEDEARVALLATLAAVWRDRPERFDREVAELYRYGDADEKRGVLRALSAIDPEPGPASLPLIDDALRTNDVRLVAAALGAYGARHLSAEAWRQGVLKCLFVGVPLAAVARLDERMDAELARMVADYCRERTAAGRSVPSDASRVLDRAPWTADDQAELGGQRRTATEGQEI